MELQKLQFSKISARIMVRTTNKPQLGHFSSQLGDNPIKKKHIAPGFLPWRCYYELDLRSQHPHRKLVLFLSVGWGCQYVGA